MYLCDVCESKSVYSVDGSSRCEKHGLRSFDDPNLLIFCSGCAEKAQRCQKCGCYVNAREYNEKQNIKSKS